MQTFNDILEKTGLTGRNPFVSQVSSHVPQHGNTTAAAAASQSLRKSGQFSYEMNYWKECVSEGRNPFVSQVSSHPISGTQKRHQEKRRNPFVSQVSSHLRRCNMTYNTEKIVAIPS